METATLEAFQQGVTSRYGAGLQVAAVSSDLRRNEFNCGAAPPRAEGNRGDPPALQKGMAASTGLPPEDPATLPPEEQARRRALLYNQRARPAPAA